MPLCTATCNAVMEENINDKQQLGCRYGEDGEDVQQCSNRQTPNEINWLTDDLIKTLNQHAPSKEEGFSANEQVDEGERWLHLLLISWKILGGQICISCIKQSIISAACMVFHKILRMEDHLFLWSDSPTDKKEAGRVNKFQICRP